MKRLFTMLLVFLCSTIAHAASPTQVTVVLDWYVNPDHAPLFVAKQQGFFKAQGLDVRFIAPADPADGPKLVAAHQADLAITYQPSLMLQVAHGLPLVRVATLVNQPLDCLVVLKAGPIKTIPDLKDKTIGYSSSGIDGLMLKTMLSYHGLALNQVQRINVHYDLTQALLAHRIDGFTGAMRNFEVIQMRLLGQPARAFYPEKNGFPSYDELIIVANARRINTAMVKKFVRAMRQGVRYLRAHPRTSWRVFSHNHPELNNRLNRASWFASLPYFSRCPGYLDRNKYQHLAMFLYEHHAIDNLPPLTHYAINVMPVGEGCKS